MSSGEIKTREQILAERQERKKKKATLKSQTKEKGKSSEKDSTECSELKIAKNKNSQNLPTANDNSNCHKKSVNSKTNSDTLFKSNNSIKNEQEGLDVKSNTLPKDLEHKKEGFHSKESPTNKDNINSKSKALESVSKPDEHDIHLEKKLVQEQSEIEPNKGSIEKAKSLTRAERRAKQEAERARKLQKSAALTVPNSEKKNVSSQPTKIAEVVKVGTKTTSEVNRKVKLFAHLYDAPLNTDVVDNPESVHPSIIQLKIQFSSRVVSGANACCLSLLNALKKVVMDFETPSNQEFSRSLQNEITRCMSYLGSQRQVAVSMVNAVKHLKFKINQCKGNEIECKNTISEWIDTYIKEQMEMAAQAISLFVEAKITVGDVILTYGWSPLIYQLLKSASNHGLKFKVIVADGRPWLEGRELLKKLVKDNINCDYVFVNGLSYVMPKVTKILLGAHSLLANGYVMSRVGSSQIALLAKTYNVPVLVCCETHKFSERVQTDSFVYNELGDPDDLASSKGCISKELLKWKSIPSLTPLNLMYDVTPPHLVSAVVTEIAVLPCTSVPVILRIKPPDHAA